MATVPPPTGAETALAAATSAAILAAPSLGDYALILLGAVIGCMHAVSKKEFNADKWEAVWYMVKWVGAALLLTSFVTTLIVSHTGFEADRWPGVVAFGITFMAEKWKVWLGELIQAVVDGLRNYLNTRGGSK